MKIRSKLITSVAAAALLVALPLSAGPMTALPLGTQQAQAQNVRVSFNIFYEQLRPHGVWVRHDRFRYVWCPQVDVRWRPYTNGRWVWLRDRGWYFQSREPFAWAVYHYGRWFRDARLGWCWVPGRNWAPAWVSWRHGGKVVGWAPLPPEEDGFQISVRINVRDDDFDRGDWFFVPTRSFLEPDLSVRVRFGSARPRLIEETRFLGPVIIQNNVVINNVINVNFIEAETNQEVTVVEAVAAENPEAAAIEGETETVAIFAPEFEEQDVELQPETAVDPEEAVAELPQADVNLEEVDAEADAQAEANAEVDIEAQLEEEPEVELEAPAADEGVTTEEEAAPEEEATTEEGAPVTECPEGQELVDGACVPIEQEQQPAAEGEAPAEEQPAETEEAAPADEEAAPAEEAAPEQEAAPVTECPEGQELVDGVCVPIAQEQQPAAEEQQPVETEQSAPAEPAPAEEPAPVEEAAPEQEAAPEEAAPEEAAPEDEAVPEEQAPAECPEGQVPYDGRCIPLDQARELGIVAE